jgi:hypothetical protein
MFRVPESKRPELASVSASAASAKLADSPH